jgi:tetratricopeptide (TPR) repeat protein
LACLSGDYQKGVTLLSELFVDTGDPAHIYNQGRCFEQNRRYEDAIGKFQEFLRVDKKISKSERQKAQRHISDCQEQVSAAEAKAAAPGPAAKHEPAEASRERPARQEAKEKVAKKACLTHEADKGVDLLTDLFVETNDPTYIYNQGRCYEQASRYEEAIERFREYLRKVRNASDADRADAEKHIADCKAVLEAKSQAEGARARTEKPLPPENESVRRQDTTISTSTLVETPASASPRSAGSGLRVGGMVVVAFGAVAMGTGVVLNLKHNNMIRDLRTNYDRDTAATADNYRTGAIVGYGIGGACIAGGAILYVLGWKAGRTAVAPMASSGLAGLTLSGGF